ncbi:maoC like domain protein [Mycobacteroides abscessus MAB_030201_1075]|uniref:MaoC like domain protein n=1 Tax=Mycobacteroides abscessus MAB_030201_1075 TaxID=1335410 RepID=A0A829PL33_9MYCO|nr:MaoC/PaaZ C-terminal domain-containing protein [Mycobacteroides abscessus]ETZ70148.1 maoC like domain protein [Mycobacteroides abscessus MAB_110811_1470]ETZ87496.1 maoC like domain protein [Mycobacteroides abscessus MAB_030201_1075]ETZ93035.1 maoC like domain protein [Mycobacteroides abscessus MAB_030201_1061]
MADTQYPFNNDGLDQWGAEETIEVDKDRLIAYAEATNDPIEEHRKGQVAAPVFAIVPIFQSLVGTTMSVVPYQLIPRVVHGEQFFKFHRPIKPGDTLVAKSKMTGYEGMENGTRGTVYAETRDAAGDLVNEQYVTFFFRKYDVGEMRGELGPTFVLDEAVKVNSPTASLTQHVDDDQTFRYGPAAGDPMPIHLDNDAAVAAGLPGIIAHGLCTMAFTSWAALTELADSRTERLKELAVRFAKPVLPGQDITTNFWTNGAAGTFSYETNVGEDLVIKNGHAVIA